MWCFYVLQSKKNQNWFYKGSTNDIKKRFLQHNNLEVQSSKHYAPLKLVYLEVYVNEKAARKREASVKKSGSVWMPLVKRIKESLKEK